MVCQINPHPLTLSLFLYRRALFSLRAENEDLKHQLTTQPQADQDDEQKVLEEEENEEEEELDVTIEDEEEESSEQWEVWDEEPGPSQGKRSLSKPQMRDLSQRKRRCTGPVSLDLGALLSHSSQVGGDILC